MTQMLSHELLCLAALRQARSDFFDSVVAYAEQQRQDAGGEPLSRADRKMLRSEGSAQIAEVFFVIEEGGVNTPDGLRGFLERHNDDMQALMATCEAGYTLMGLSETRIRDSVFSQGQIDLIVHESSHGGVTFDQRSLGKILVQTMSFESCRTLLLLLADVGLLNRNSFQKIVLISPNGSLEELYRDHLRFIVGSLSGQNGPG